MEKQKFNIEGYEILTKTAMSANSSGRIYVPKRWVGRKVIIILTEQAKD